MSYREERRADQAAERADNREDRRLLLEAQLKAKEIDAENRRRDSDAKAELVRRDAAEKRRLKQAERKARESAREAKKAASAVKRAKVVGWLRTNPATLFVAFVMVASIVPAVISQVGALSGAGVFGPMAGLLAAMLEGGAWAITFMGKQAEDAGRETRKYRAATWLTACVAAAVNLWHGLEQYAAHPWVAFVLAGSSLFAIYVWDMKTHGSHGRTKAEKKEQAAREKHAADRRKHHKDIAREADRLLSAMPYGSITEEEAFAAAWRIHRGAEPGMSAELYATATNSRVQLGAAFELGEHVRPELLRTGLLASALNPLPDAMPTLGRVTPLTALRAPEQGAGAVPIGMEKPQVESQVPPASKTPSKTRAKAAGGTPVPPRRRKGDTPSFHPAARVAAAETARRAVTARAS
ncbi:AAA family ATPase [Actinacidiphila paucisporea]|uniref:DUF2637 domain-containing protein n=1 Tax=Actinacidiphila paucisporea TaxID=310782 RepID=A0A1M6TGY9_9ACTN|nr:hypothetical protein [Actinacidiphila paucisporea]SHK56106.1 hypothetical protein SAMN05216499_10139 [Actinacidiphila paucisporea]